MCVSRCIYMPEAKAQEREDSAKFLELLLSDCEGGDSHAWRRCKKCQAIHMLEINDALAVKLINHAIKALKP